MLDSTSLLALETLPESLIVVVGYIGAELVQLIARMGSESPFSAGRGCSGRPSRRSRRRSSTCPLRRRHAALRDHKWGSNGVTNCLEDNGRRIDLTVSHLLLAVGLLPNTEVIGLFEAGMIVDHRGAIVVGDDIQSSVPAIYAAGGRHHPRPVRLYGRLCC